MANKEDKQFQKIKALDFQQMDSSSSIRPTGSQKQQKSQLPVLLVIVGVIISIACIAVAAYFLSFAITQYKQQKDDQIAQTEVNITENVKQYYEQILQKQAKIRQIFASGNYQQQQLSVDKITEDDYKDSAEKYVTPQLQKILKQNRQFDIHYYIDDQHLNMKPKVLNRAKKHINYKDRPILDLNSTVDELQSIVEKMKHPKKRTQPNPNWQKQRKILPSLMDQMFMAGQLNDQPDNPEYAKGQFYYYDRKYNIGKYYEQLPMCVVAAGKNNAGVVIKMYESIRRQNYTNFRVVQIDDNSNDDTIKVVMDYLNKNPYMKQRTTLVHQMYQRTALYNRHYGNIEHCPEDSIIVDVDTDDWVVGKQVLQVVNSIYQAGNYVNGERYQVWSLFLDFIFRGENGMPISKLYGQIEPKFFNTYRIEHAWRTTELRTYYRKVYAKVDPKDFVDMHSMRKGQFFGETYDLYMIVPIFEHCQPNHVKILDEFVYFYTGSGGRDENYPQYSSSTARSLPVYTPLKSLNDPPVRGNIIAPQNLIGWRDVMANAVDKRFAKYRAQVLQLYEKDKKKYIQNQNKK